MNITKEWKITGRNRDFSILWKYRGDLGIGYFIGNSKTPREWKTKQGARKFAINFFRDGDVEVEKFTN